MKNVFNDGVYKFCSHPPDMNPGRQGLKLNASRWISFTYAKEMLINAFPKLIHCLPDIVTSTLAIEQIYCARSPTIYMDEMYIH